MISSNSSVNSSTSLFGFGKQVKKITLKTPITTSLIPDTYEEECSLKLKQALIEIFSQNQPTQSLEELYQTCQNLCILSFGQRLYARVAVEIDQHVSKLQQSLHLACQTLYPLGFLEAFVQTWKTLGKNICLAQKIFMYLDRTYVLENTDLLSIWDYSTNQFKIQIIQDSEAIRTKLTSSMLELIERERLGAEVNRSLIKEVISIFIEFECYDDAFEASFLRSSTQYYSSLMSKKFSELSIASYLDFVLERIAEESLRIDECCSLKTKTQILRIVETFGLKENLQQIMTNGLPVLFDSFNVDSLAKLYSLMERIDQVEAFKAAFCGIIRKKGAFIIGQFDSNDNLSIMKDLILFKRKNFHLLAKAFHNNESFSNAIKDAFEDFLNIHQHKPAELLAKYFDSVLKNTLSSEQKSSFGDSESLINELVQIFRYIHGKDIFEAFYKKDLAKRLLLFKNFSIDMENLVISKLKSECGVGFTSKLEGMFKDIAVSKELKLSYDEYIKSKQPTKPISKLRTKKSAAKSSTIEELECVSSDSPVEFSVNVLSSGFWPNYPDSPVNLPTDIEEMRNSFANFYQQKFSGRQIKWQNSLSNCIIKANFPKGPKELVVSAHQAAVLLMFNSDDIYSYLQIKQETGMNDAELQKALLSLSCSKVRILSKEPKTVEIADSDTFRYNEDFVAKLFRLKINSVQLKESQEETSMTTATVLEDRQLQIDAAIMRVMKMKRTLSHNSLLTEAMSLLKFPVTAVDLKKRIESLIEREFIERDSENNAIYHYIA